MLTSNYKKSLLLIATFSFGKIIAATGQTLFSVKHIMSYAFTNINFDYAIPAFFAGCTFLVISITRIPAMYRQFGYTSKDTDMVMPLKGERYYLIIFFYFIVISSYFAGIFSAVGAYLGAITIFEFASNMSNNSSHILQESIYVNLFSVLIAIASFASYYSFNIQKAKYNAANVIVNFKNNNIFFFNNKTFLKTFFVSVLNVASIPFIAYFLTKNAIYKMAFISSFFSAGCIKWIAFFSAITALITCLATTVPAMHEYFSQNKKINEIESMRWSMLRFATYFSGLFDSVANGLGNFLGVIYITYDLFNISIYNNHIIILAIGCGISATLLNLAFSIRQGFNDLSFDAGKDNQHSMASEK